MTRMLQMSQNKFEMPLELDLKPSKYFKYYLVILIVFSSMGIVVSSLSLLNQFFLVLLLIVSFFFVFKKNKQEEITAIKLNLSDEWKIKLKNTNWVDAELCGECIVVSFLTWLNFSIVTSPGQKKIVHLLLLPDSADKNFLRRLRVRLRFLSKTDAGNSILDNKV